MDFINIRIAFVDQNNSWFCVEKEEQQQLIILNSEIYDALIH